MDRFEGEIRSAYKAYARPSSPCLSTEDLAAFYTDGLPDEMADQIRSHLAYCGLCLELARDYCVFTQEKRDQSPRGIAGVFPKALPAYLKVAAAILIIVAVGVTAMRTFQTSETDVTTRGIDSNLEPLPIAPKGTLQEPPRILEWQPAAAADHYDVEIQDPRFNVVWRQQRIQGTTIAVPPDLFPSLPDGRYAWRVFAVTGAGRRVVTAFAVFEVHR